MEKTGELTNVFNKENLGEYASSFLKGRKKYILIKITPSVVEEGKNHEVFEQQSDDHRLH